MKALLCNLSCDCLSPLFYICRLPISKLLIVIQNKVKLPMRFHYIYFKNYACEQSISIFWERLSLRVLMSLNMVDRMTKLFIPNLMVCQYIFKVVYCCSRRRKCFKLPNFVLFYWKNIFIALELQCSQRCCRALSIAVAFMAQLQLLIVNCNLLCDVAYYH